MAKKTSTKAAGTAANKATTKKAAASKAPAKKAETKPAPAQRDRIAVADDPT